MLQDSLALTPGSIALNSLIENGITLPATDLKAGRVFYLTEAYDGNKIGAYVYDDVNAWTMLGAGAVDVVKYDIGLFCGGKVDISEAILASYLAPRPIFMESQLPGSVARCKTPPLAYTVYTLNVNDVSVGYVSFDGGSNVGTIVMAYSQMVDIGQTIELMAPTTPDIAISDVGITIVANVSVAPGVLSEPYVSPPA